MNALVLNALGRGFDFEGVDFAAPIGREVLIDVRESGLCHTDLLFATHDFVPTPAVLGHEVAGVVAAVGLDVAQLRVGDHVVGSLAQSCGACARCLSGRSFQCRHPESTLRRPTDAPRHPRGRRGTLMSKHAAISPEEAADRLAIRELVEAYAHCADRRDAKGQMSLFTEDTHFVVYMNAKDPVPSTELRSREALAPVFADLNKYDATTHFVGQNTILTLSADRSTGETYCLAHHITIDGGKRRLMIASLRYLDTFVKVDEAWLFAERLLYVDWLEERGLA
jgi:Alcohol dehydrogenase GroES-like domain/SnoaL-like domain